MSPKVPVAAFDFDGTLTERDSVVPFLRRVGGTMRLGARMLSRPDRLSSPIVRRDRDRIKEIASRSAFRNRAVGEIDAVARRFAAELVERHLRSDTPQRLRWHLDAGHRVVLVSASYDLYLRHVAPRLGVDHVVATRLEVEGDRFTGRLVGRNCRGPEKVARLRDWLTVEGLERDDIQLYAYGDSAGDRELLAFADHACWVDQPLLAIGPAD